MHCVTLNRITVTNRAMCHDLLGSCLFVCWHQVVERCKEDGSPDGVYLYHAADMADPDSAADLIQVQMNVHLCASWSRKFCSL